MVKRALPPLKTLRAFEAAARLANFTAAADELSITHSAVSQQIRLLEDYLAQPLFAREARGVVLLPHARDYFLEVQACLDRISTATLTLKSPGAPRILRVSTTPSLAMKWLIPRLADFQDWEPGVEVQLSTVNSRFIERQGFRKPADCLGLPLLQVQGCMDDWPHWFGLAGLQVPSQLPGPVFDHHFLSAQAAMNDLGVALAPWCLVEDDIQSGRLQPLFEQPRLTGAGLYALYKTDNPVTTTAKRFVDWLHAATQKDVQA